MWEHLRGQTLTDRGRQLEKSREQKQDKAAEEDGEAQEAAPDQDDEDEEPRRSGQQELTAFTGGSE